MPKVSSARRDAIDDFSLVMSTIRKQIVDHAGGETEPAYTREVGSTVYIRVGKADLLLHPPLASATAIADNAASLYSFDELTALEFVKPDAVVEGLIFEGDTVLLAGRPKVGKSRLIHQMALAITRGCPFLGLSVPRARPVLIVDLENRPWAIRDRLVRMAAGDADDRGPSVWCANSLSADAMNATPEGISALKGMIERTSAEVVFIDPWRLFLGKDENDAEAVVHGLRALSRLREANPQLTVIIVHHVRKERIESTKKLLNDPRLWADTVSGHHALSSHVDAVFGLERQRDDDGEEWIVFGGIARNTEPATMLLDDDEQSLRFELRRSEGALDMLLTNAEREIWKAAVRLKKFTFTKLVAEANTTNRKAVTSTLRKAESHGLVNRSGSLYEVVAATAERN